MFQDLEKGKERIGEEWSMLEYRSVRRWLEIAWEKCGVVQNSAEMIGGGIGGNMVHDK